MRLILSIVEGQNVRNLLENNFLPALWERWEDLEVVMVSPAYGIREFVEKWGYDGRVRFEKLLPVKVTAKSKIRSGLRKKFVRKGYHRLADYLRKQERQESFANEQYLRDLLQEKPGETMVLCTHIHLPHEKALANLAFQMNIPVLGIVNSWDNVYKGITTHVDHALVWNKVNYREMMEMEGYRMEELSIMGVHAFDPYFKEDTLLSREEFCSSVGLDPQRPILVYASIGQFVPFFEETYLLDELLEYRKKFSAGDKPQIICRLHPWSKKALFRKFEQEEGIIFSEFQTYVPTINWAPTLEEVKFSANMLNHADICISPGSTMVLESAFFDTPAVIPVYNNYQKEIWEDYYKNYCLAWHFGRIIENGWAELARDQSMFFAQMDKYLAHPEYMKEGRAQIVEEYIGTERAPIKKILDTMQKVFSDKLK